MANKKYKLYRISSQHYRVASHQYFHLNLMVCATSIKEAASILGDSVGYVTKYSNHTTLTDREPFEGVWATTDHYHYPQFGDNPRPLAEVKKFIDENPPKQ